MKRLIKSKYTIYFSSKKLFNFIRNPLNTKIVNDLDNSKILIIRHIETILNSDLRNSEKSGDHETSILIKSSLKYLDAQVTDRGIEKMTSNQPIFSKYKFSHVFVSPLQRTLVTCMKALELMSQPIPPKVIIHPLLFEKIEDFGDLIRDGTQTISQFKSFTFNGNEYSIDWDKYIEMKDYKDIYQLKYCDRVIKKNKMTNTFDITIENKKQSYYNLGLERIGNQQSKSDYLNSLGSTIYNLHSNGLTIESSISTNKRIKQVLDDINSLLKNDIVDNDDAKILIIGHSQYFLRMYANRVNKFDLSPDKDERILGNCEIVGLRQE